MDEAFAALVHEISQPLQAICNYANACSRLISAGDRDSVSKALAWTSQISQEAMRVAEMARRMRDSFRGVKSNRSQLDLNGLVRSALEVFARETGYDVMAIALDLADALPAVEADSLRIEQVLLNLIRNGMEAVNGTVAPRILIRTTDRNGKVEISVQDNGVGLEPEHVERMFDPFFTTKSNGTGMGLAISRRIVQDHGGSIWCTQNSGHGTTMHVTLPVTGDRVLLQMESNVISLSRRQAAA